MLYMNERQTLITVLTGTMRINNARPIPGGFGLLQFEGGGANMLEEAEYTDNLWHPVFPFWAI